MKTDKAACNAKKSAKARKCGVPGNAEQRDASFIRESDTSSLRTFIIRKSQKSAASQQHESHFPP
jgi:hypothetical protein